MCLVRSFWRDVRLKPVVLDASETFSFRTDPHGTHRLTVEMSERATVDRLLIVSADSTMKQASCTTYEFDRERGVDLEPERPAPTNRFETGRDRSADDERRYEAPPRERTTA